MRTTLLVLLVALSLGGNALAVDPKVTLRARYPRANRLPTHFLRAESEGRGSDFVVLPRPGADLAQLQNDLNRTAEIEGYGLTGVEATYDAFGLFVKVSQNDLNPTRARALMVALAADAPGAAAVYAVLPARRSQRRGLWFYDCDAQQAHVLSNADATAFDKAKHPFDLEAFGNQYKLRELRYDPDGDEERAATTAKIEKNAIVRASGELAALRDLVQHPAPVEEMPKITLDPKSPSDLSRFRPTFLRKESETPEQDFVIVPKEGADIAQIRADLFRLARVGKEPVFPEVNYDAYGLFASFNFNRFDPDTARALMQMLADGAPGIAAVYSKPPARASQREGMWYYDAQTKTVHQVAEAQLKPFYRSLREHNAEAYLLRERLYVAKLDTDDLAPQLAAIEANHRAREKEVRVALQAAVTPATGKTERCNFSGVRAAGLPE